MSTFYKPISIKVQNVPIILYPTIGIEDVFDRTKSWELESHIIRLFSKHPSLQECSFQIIILWKDKNPMTDIWLFHQLENEDVGYTIGCKTFRNLKEEKGEGITASDGLIMLGREAELEESLRKSRNPFLIESYIQGKRPDLPNGLQPTESFFI